MLLHLQLVPRRVREHDIEAGPVALEDLGQLERPVEERLLLCDLCGISGVGLGLERVELRDPLSRARNAEALRRPAVVDAREQARRLAPLQLRVSGGVDILKP